MENMVLLLEWLLVRVGLFSEIVDYGEVNI